MVSWNISGAGISKLVQFSERPLWDCSSPSTQHKHEQSTSELIKANVYAKSPRLHLRDDNFDIILFISSQGIVAASLTGLLNCLLMLHLVSNTKHALIVLSVVLLKRAS